VLQSTYPAPARGRSSPELARSPERPSSRAILPLVTDACPLVSIVTPTLNQGRFIEATIRSVRAQTYGNYEHIVVDGGSTDGTLDVLRANEGTYPMRWISEPDRGMYDAVNKGMRLATGDILCYLNSDDLYFPWTLEAVVEAFAGDPGADLVFGEVVRVDDLRGIIVPVFVPPYRAGAMAAYGTLSQPAVFLRRRVLEEMGGFDSSLRYVADLEFWLRAGGRFRFRRVDEFLALEQRHREMLSVSARDRMAVEDVRVRTSYRTGILATRAGRFAAYVRWHWWSGRRWIAFVAATRGGRGWERTRAVLAPRVGALDGALGWLPSKGSRLRAATRWTRDPMAVASGRVEG
jgi:glycosyltransferase involved in cell wall biosynthesis